jgi:type VI secretion system protein ImpG
LHWKLISNMSLNYVSLVNVRALRVVLSTYNFQAYYDRQAARAHELRLEGIENISAKPIDRIFKGVPIRGLRLQMDMKGSRFAGEGELYLLASVLNEFFALYATINSFHELEVRNVERGEVYQWPARIGQQPIL